MVTAEGTIVKADSLSSLRAALCAGAFAVIPGCLPDGSSPELPLLGAGEGGGSGTAAGSGAGTGAGGRSAGATAGRGTTSGAAGASGMAASAGAAGRAMMPAAGASGARAGGAGMGAAGRSGAAGSTAGASGSMGMAAGAGGSGGMGGRGGAGGGAAGAAGAAGGGMAGAAGGGGAATATFTQVYGLIMAGCSCHVSGSSGGLSMANKMTAYTNLVGANSTACSGQKRVVANDPTNSVLFHSIERTMLGSCNVPQMPAGGTKWSQADIDKVKAWIMAGAMNN